MDFDKDNFEEDNELAPLEEEEAGDVEVAGVEIDEIVAEDDTEDEAEVPKRASSGPKRGSAGSSGSGSSRASTRKSAGGQKGPAKKASAGKSKSSSKKSAKKKSGSSRGKASKKPAKKASRGKKKKR
jgi:hypothetical protein